MVEVASLGALCALLGTIAMVLVLRPFASWVGLVDRPDTRKQHEGPTPAIGGVAMFLAIGGLALTFQPASRQTMGFGLAALLLVMAGIIDDHSRLRWYVRMGAQLGAALILIHVAGISVENLGEVIGFSVHRLGALSDVVTIIAVVGVINAVNMMDGIDGLAGSVSLAAIGLLIALSAYAGNLTLARDLAVVAGALVGFLLFNLRTPWNPKASIFMGNAGSDLLGLMIAAACFRLTQNVHHPISPKLAPFLLAPALLDCLTLILRRCRRGVSPFLGDREHLHHLLLDSGFSVSGVVCLASAATLAIATAALLAAKVHAPGPLFTVAFIVMWAAYFLATRSRERFVQVMTRGAARLGWLGLAPTQAAAAKIAQGAPAA